MKARGVSTRSVHHTIGRAETQKGEAGWEPHIKARPELTEAPAQYFHQCPRWCSVGGVGHREFICLFKYFLSIYVLGTGDMVGNKTDENTCPPEVHSPVEGETINKTDTLPRTSEGSEF